MYYYFGDYVSVEEQRAKAAKEIQKLRRKGFEPAPVEGFKGRISRSFWGSKWCANLEAYADMVNRIDRGKRYVRAGCVCHLEIGPGNVQALVSGTKMYKVAIRIAPLAAVYWKEICARCSRDIGSMLELMQGKLSKNVMEIVSSQKSGLFPSPGQITFSCSCPDGADMCKHVTAALYGIGRRLDESPELLFLLRGVDPNDLVSHADFNAPTASDVIGSDKLADIFGIDLELEEIQKNTDNPLARSAAAVSPPPVPHPDKNLTLDGSAAPKIPGTNSAASRKNPAAKKAASPAPKTRSGKKKAAKKTMPHITRPPFNPAKPSAAGIYALRKLSGLSQKTMAKQLGISTSSIIRWEHSSDELSLQAQSLQKLNRFQERLLRKLAGK